MLLGINTDCSPEVKITTCRLVVRKKPDPAEILEFVVGGIEIGQQIVVLAAPTWLKDLARVLGDTGLRPETLIRNGRLVFMTAPSCLTRYGKLNDPLRRPLLRRNGSIVRWISDWSWAYGNGTAPSTVLSYQRRIHECTHELAAMSLCTVHCENLERSSMLALLLHHRRAARNNARPV
jgi:MEDS: MEthanogen/methylotroph, DcmR Sensory domain